MPPNMRQFVTFAILLLGLKSVDPLDRPPSIYEWIEENAHICTSIPVDGRNVVNFLTPNEGVKCSLCPETPSNKVPTSACAVEVSPNEVDVEIGCHPVPELCILELRTRYEEFFGGLRTTGTNPAQNTSPQEEEIFMAKSNPFDGNIIASLGRSSNNNPTSESQQNNAPTSQIPHSSVFLASHQSTSTQAPTTFTTTNPPSSTTTPVSTTVFTSPLRHSPTTVQTTHKLETTTSVAQTDSDLLQVDADSGDSQIPSTTVRANVFSSPNRAPIHIAGRLDEIANRGRVSIPMHSTSSTRSPLIGITLSLNKEIMPNEQAKLNPSKSLFEKRNEAQSASTSRPFTNNSWALFRSASPPTTTFLPLTRTTKRSIPETQFNRSAKLLSNDDECKDQNQLCCFWAIAGECDTNPFWMRVKCSKTCGTCNCSLREADQCVSTGIKCTIPTTTTTVLTTTPSTTQTTTPSTTSTTTEPSTSKLTPPPKFNRFTVKMRNLPPWKKQPLENPAGPPSFRPNNEEDGSSVSNQVQTSVPATTQSVPVGYADGDSVKATSFVRRPGIKGPTTTASVENSLETDETEPFTTSTASTSTQVTTPTPGNCFNYNRLCAFWADLGECERNPFWMRPHCQLACRSCGETLNDVFAPKPKADCANQAVLCPFWAFIGECARNPRWMLKNCAPSCQVC